MRPCLLAVLLLLAGAVRAEPRLVADPAAETVFRWATQRCDRLHVPDSPARAIRTADGGVLLMAAHFTNIVLRGRDFDSLAPDCASASRGAEDPDPTRFDDRFWVQALWPLPDGRVLGLASHEFMGKRHAGRCEVTQGPGGTRCWHSAITLTVAEPGPWRFRPLPLPQRVLAASPAPYDPAARRRSGAFSVTNILRAEGFLYLLAYLEGIPGQPDGNCLLRAPEADPVAGWRALAADGTFRAELGLSRGDAGPCIPVGPFQGAARSLLRLGPAGPYVATFAGRVREGEGVLVTTSPDLRRWSPPRLLLAAAPWRAQPEAGFYVAYPALIDHGSASPVFDSADGGRLHLYLTRLNLAPDRRDGMNRDLIRHRVRVEGG
jgi:hypothetical protein